jgi:hypothetical protein
MAAVGDSHAQVTVAVQEKVALVRCTTLYELIAALHTVAGPEDDVWVVTTVVHLLRSGTVATICCSRAGAA